MKITQLNDASIADILDQLLKRSPTSYQEFEGRVQDIINNVREKGDEAVFDYTAKFDGILLSEDSIRVTEEEIEEAYRQVDPALLDVIRKSIVNIRAFHEKQRHQSWFDAAKPGIILGQRVTALERVGVYVPGGRAAYPSSVLMNVVPAHVAGVPNIVMRTPPDKSGKVYAPTLVAAKEAG